MPGMVNIEEIEKETDGEVILPRDGKGGRLDGGKDFGTGFRIELMPVETKKEPLSNGLNRSLWIMLTEGCLDKGACGVPHGTSHDEPFFTGPLHEHNVVALLHVRRCIVHADTSR